MYIFIIALIFSANSLSFSQPVLFWSNQYGYTGIINDRGVDIQLLEDGGYILLMNVPNGQAWSIPKLVRLDSDGQILWTEQYGELPGTAARAVVASADGGFLISGDRLIKVSAFGQVEWHRSWNYGHGTAALEVEDGRIVVAGDSGYQVEEPIFINEISSVGELVASHHFGLSFELGVSTIHPTASGGFILCGSASADQQFLLTLDQDFQIGLFRRFDQDETWPLRGRGRDAIESVDGYYYAGQVLEGADSAEAFVMKLDQGADTVWTRNLSAHFLTDVRSLFLAADGGVYLAGTYYDGVEHDFALARLSTSGEILWVQRYPALGRESLMNARRTIDGGFVMVGTIIPSPWRADWDAWVIATGPDILQPADGPVGSVLPTNIELRVWPNPFNPTTTIFFQLPEAHSVKIGLRDLLGRQVGIDMNESLPSGSYTRVIDGTSLAAGAYLVVLEAGDFTVTKKIVLLR